ncbi:MAG: T9SS type A sorting domain-containing protein [candidate division KSB1 bacterium]|nr:T9SS type A sorting domain-containing protein [candidate division KSB1 bacterium]
MKKIFFFFVFLCTARLFAQDFAVFTGLGGNNSWDNPANWSTNKVPGETDEVYIPKGKKAELGQYCGAKKLTIEGSVVTNNRDVFVGSNLWAEQLIIKKGGEIEMQAAFIIQPITDRLNIENQGLIFTDMNKPTNRLVIGDDSPGKDIRMNISGGEITNADFQFNGLSLNLNDANIVGLVNIHTDFMSMTGESVIDALGSEPFNNFPINIFFNKKFFVDKGCEIRGNQIPKDNGQDIDISGNTFINYGTLLPGRGNITNGEVAIRAQHLYNHGSIGGGSGSASGNILGKKSTFVEDNPFSNVILSGDSVVIAMQDTSMILADTLKVYGNHIVVAIQIEAGIALFNGIEFYTPADGTIDFTQTTVNNAIAGGYSKQIHSNHILPENQAQIQMIFFGNVNFSPADTTKTEATASLTNGYGFANTDGTLCLNLQNLSTAAKSIHYEVSSKLGWVNSFHDSTAVLAPFALDSAKIPYHIPPETIRGAEDLVQVRVLINGIIIDTVYSTITCLSKSTNPGELAIINITPTEVNMSVGEKQQFTAVGLTADADTLDYFKPSWSATGGMIDSTGLYTATQAGNFFVICADTAAGKNATAMVHVGPTDVETEDGSVPAKFALQQNYPNPFNSITKIKFSIPKSSLNSSSKADGTWVSLKVYDILGNEVMTLVNGYKSAGVYEVELNASQLASGVYIYQLKGGAGVNVRKMILMK